MQTLLTFEKSVPFVDTDMAGIVHFSKVLCYVEEAEHAAMSKIGVPVMSKEGGFPKVHVDCDYKSPLKFQDVVSVSLNLVKVGGRSLTWSFVVRVGDKISAEGGFVTVYTSRSAGGSVIQDAQRILLESHLS